MSDIDDFDIHIESDPNDPGLLIVTAKPCPPFLGGDWKELPVKTIPDLFYRRLYHEGQMTDEQIEQWFAYQGCSELDVEAMTRWRTQLGEVAKDFSAYVPHENIADKIHAMRALKTAMMAMNAALVAPMPKGKGKDGSGPGG